MRYERKLMVRGIEQKKEGIEEHISDIPDMIERQRKDQNKSTG